MRVTDEQPVYITDRKTKPISFSVLISLVLYFRYSNYLFECNLRVPVTTDNAWSIASCNH